MKNEALQQIFVALRHLSVGEAVSQAENYLLMHQSRHYDTFVGIKDDFLLMLDYFRRGYPDEHRPAVYRQLARRLYVLVANIDWDARVEASAYLSGLRRQTMQARRDWSVPAVRHALEDYVSAVALLDLEQPHVRQQKAAACHQEHQQYMSLLFARILTSGQWKEAEGTAFADLLLSPTVQPVDQQLLVSAVTLACMQMFDYEKFHALLTVYRQSTDEPLRQRALTGWVLGADSSVTTIYPAIDSDVRQACDDEQCRQELTELQLQMLYAMNAEDDTRIIQKEIIPDLMKGGNMKITSHGLVEMEEDRLEEILHPDAAEQNMERMEQSMQRMVDMQKQGADIYFGGFSQMKRFPFFSDLSNWFVPYYADHPAVSSILQNTRGRKFLEIITRVGAFCDSDKYSFVLGFNQVLDRIPDSMLKLIDEGEAIPTPVGGELTVEEQQQPAFMRRMYLQDLYRFYRVFPARSEFHNPFSREQQQNEYVFFANALFAQPALARRAVEVASFLVKHHRHDDALRVLDNSSETGDDVRYWLLLGHLWSSATTDDPRQACKAYREALRLQPGSDSALAGYARALFRLGEYDEALTQFQTLSQRRPDHRGYALNTAVCLTRTGRSDEALPLLYRLHYDYPDDMAVWRTLAWAETLSGKYEQALHRYDRLVGEAEKPVADDLLNNAVCLWLTGRVGDAATLFHRYVGDGYGDRSQLATFLMDSEHQTLAARGITDTDIHLMLDFS